MVLVRWVTNGLEMSPGYEHHGTPETSEQNDSMILFTVATHSVSYLALKSLEETVAAHGHKW